MKKTINLMALMLVFMLPALTTPSYAASHAKDDTATTDTDTDKKKGEAEEDEDEEPECD